MPFPIIDISNIDDPKYQLKIAQQITDACKQWGFLLIKGHPIPPEDIQEMFNLGKEFFSLPEDDKAPWPINKNQIGYIGSFKDRNKDDKMSMWFGGLPGTLEKDLSAAPPFWRTKANKIEAFKHECHALVLKLLVCFGIAMDLPDREFFAKAHKGEHWQRQQLEDVDVAGLEVLAPNGEWVKAPCEKDCILINLGDALSFWSGNQLKATLHRVTFDELPHDKERQSMAYFGAAHPDTVLQPLLSGVKMGEYHSNGMSLEPGITVGELNNRIMTSIYGPALKV
ncbi:uncharacterized protein PAC_17485 [Phialocephala subalpina]|uniref:Gibberellin 20-oxidase n=1 Tax=Phialocephala subalpina TaxID=576137 RepID=A0A1L7XRB3_9HELO|nr:uncharacterized protein PAC_17485 [Phialocephala subalpina]